MFFETIHLLNGRASSVNLTKYKHAILIIKIFLNLIIKIYNKGEPPKDGLALNFNQVLPVACIINTFTVICPWSRANVYFAVMKCP